MKCENSTMNKEQNDAVSNIRPNGAGWAGNEGN
jgi:hypothetical protein